MAEQETQLQPMSFDCEIGEKRYVVNTTGRTLEFVFDFREGGEISFSVPAGSCFSYKRTKHAPMVRVK